MFNLNDRIVPYSIRSDVENVVAALHEFLVVQNFKTTKRMDGTINSFDFSVVFKKKVCLKALSANSRQKNLLANDELQENRGLYKIGRHRKQRRL